MGLEVLRKIARVSHASGFTRLCYLANRGRCRVLTYHNVIPDRYFDDALHLGEAVKGSVFHAQVEHVLRRFPVGTDLRAPGTAVFTFDDGYVNQFEVGLAHLAANGVPAYCFCSLNLLQSQMPSPVDALYCWISYAPPGRYAFRTREGEAEVEIDGDSTSRHRAWARVSELVLAGMATRSGVLDDLSRVLPLEQVVASMHPEYARLRFGAPSASEISRARDDGHLIGAHSVYHDTLAALSAADLRRDIAQCAAQIGILYNTGMFAYPFGTEDAVSEEVVKAVREAGFSEAVACISRPLRRGRHYGRYFIPRMMMPNTDDTVALDFVLSGAYNAIKHRRLLPSW